MKNTNLKLMAITLTLTVLMSLTGCGSVITGSLTGEGAASGSEELPFEVAEDPSDMRVGQIGKYDDDFYCGLAGVRSMENVESRYTREQLSRLYYDIPVVYNNQEVIYPLVYAYNNSNHISAMVSSNVSLYVDSVQVDATDPDYMVFVDGFEVNNYNPIDEGETALLTQPFIVDKGWSEIKVFCGSLCWTVTPDDVKAEPVAYEPMFGSDDSYDYSESGDVLYSGQIEVTYDGCEVELRNSRRYLVFEFTASNQTNDTLVYRLGSSGYYCSSRLYCNSRFINVADHYMDTVISGHTNLYDDNTFNHSLEIHAGMSAQFYIAFEIFDETGVFECYFDPEFHDDMDYSFMELSRSDMVYACTEYVR